MKTLRASCSIIWVVGAGEVVEITTQWFYRVAHNLVILWTWILGARLFLYQRKGDSNMIPRVLRVQQLRFDIDTFVKFIKFSILDELFMPLACCLVAYFNPWSDLTNLLTFFSCLGTLNGCFIFPCLSCHLKKMSWHLFSSLHKKLMLYL